MAFPRDQIPYSAIIVGHCFVFRSLLEWWCGPLSISRSGISKDRCCAPFYLRQAELRPFLTQLTSLGLSMECALDSGA